MLRMMLQYELSSMWKTVLIFSALLLSYVLTSLVCRKIISRGKISAISIPIKLELAVSQMKKAGTPSFGGIAFILGTTLSVFLLGDLRESYTWIPLVAIWIFGCIGFIDDYAKLTKNSSDGITSRQKMAMQIIAAGIVMFLVNSYSGMRSTHISLPWNPAKTIDIGAWYQIAALFYILYFVNAVNITDGLDGLAAGTGFSILVLFFLIAIIFGLGFGSSVIQSVISGSSLHLALVICAFLGGLLAFLWYNSNPAQVFMGDCGSHALGTLIAVTALLLKIELIALLASGVFLVEFMTSLLQIVTIRAWGRKFFSIAPIHHMYEQKGMSENKIVSRFRILGILCVIVAFIFFTYKYL
ncbi:phospho-N-acetylmuramoyl-pentapeptide-transferase [Parasphaerochaeta coccoides]|uniref:Phospho-N-acetylmuramoyl-pentapeptide-transferase n=1 Tax=Parasphaerochaeta coccoides (strain ATCC BAA-1237 / DSM 17374 / SPN1) TaxID=760011 RepID=F4GKW7_PARC1|nr:phospho-N-acetylmuramoyl-pentapeptide-transferase [Parasphaerochaeta coccoides]AEC01880.1 Phospho-N-acetylmuramoyl-pentapeptide-transferase [Parasphaerochaeta coccoides DSM 17374]